MDDELKALAGLALRNAFWCDFSALVNGYIAAAEGLDTVEFVAQIQDGLSVYSRDESARTDHSPVSIECDESKYDSILRALELGHRHVWINGEPVFERRDGEWYFTGDE